MFFFVTRLTPELGQQSEHLAFCSCPENLTHLLIRSSPAFTRDLPRCDEQIVTSDRFNLRFHKMRILLWRIMIWQWTLTAFMRLIIYDKDVLNLNPVIAFLETGTLLNNMTKKAWPIKIVGGGLNKNPFFFSFTTPLNTLKGIVTILVKKCIAFVLFTLF